MTFHSLATHVSIAARPTHLRTDRRAWIQLDPRVGFFSGSGVWKDMTISISPRGMPRLNLHWHLGFMARGNLAFSAGTQYGVTIDHSSTKSKVWKSAYWCFKWGINIKTWNIQSYRVHPHARSSHGVEISSHDDGRCLLTPLALGGCGPSSFLSENIHTYSSLERRICIHDHTWMDTKWFVKIMGILVCQRSEVDI